MDRAQLFIVAGATLGAGYLLTQFYASLSPDELPDDLSDDYEHGLGNPTGSTFLEEIMAKTVNVLQLWRPPAQYAGLIAAAEIKYGIPADMLARQLYQECRWRQDIITGRVLSPRGAAGIAQFMPATAAEWGVNPLDPVSAIDGAGRYMKWLRTKFSTWAETLGAYNWGIGNMQRKGIAAAPQETRLYYGQILNDINTSNGTAYA